jgi:APA family basic amino acid/polyamine antiporter
VAPTWGQFFLAIPVGMIAYTGIETVSNLAEEARDPVRSIPRSIGLVAAAVYAIYFTLPLVALSALPVREVRPGHFETLLALPPEKHGFQNDPVLGLVQHLGIHDPMLSVLKVYVGILAATILFIATNAGIIGASRITYSMSSYRQLPDAFRRLHPKFKTPWLSLVVFAGLVPIIVILPGKTAFLGTMYSFGAMLSFTVAHLAVIQLRRRYRGEELAFRAWPNLKLGSVDWPLFAIFGAIGTALAWLVVVVQSPSTRYAGIGWLVVGFLTYLVYRRRFVHAPLTETVKAPILIGPAFALEYRTIVVPLVEGEQAVEAMHMACRLAGERRSAIVAIRVIVVPLDLPLDAPHAEQDELADRLPNEAHDIGELYGVQVIERLVRARHAGRAIVEEAGRRHAEIIVMGAPRLPHRTRKSAIFGKTVDFVLKNSPARVMVAATTTAA